MIKYKYKEIKEFIENNSKCELLSTEYINTNEKLLLKCSCGKNFMTSFTKFKNRNKRQCNDCGRKIGNSQKKLSYDLVKDFIENNSNCFLLSTEYNRGNEKLLLKCNCGNEFKTSYFEFRSLNKRQCNECGFNITAKKLKLSLEEAKQVFINNGYMPLFDYYINANQKLTGIDDHGYKVFVNISNLKNKNTRIFNKCNPYSYENMLNYLNLNESSYKLLDKKYKNFDIYKYKFKCDKGHEYYSTWSNFLIGNRCPICNLSKGERKIYKILYENYVEFEQEYTFDDLVGVNSGLLRFDFAIFEDKKKTKLKFLIEYDGEFHYRKVYFNDNFKILQIHDKLKNEYCIKNNIKLLRIPYWNFNNIEKILQEELLNYVG